MIPYILALLLTVVLGPGAGHVILRQYKRAAVFFISAVGLTLAIAWRAAAGLSVNSLSLDDAARLFKTFAQEHPRAILFFDAGIAALWAAALVDIILMAMRVYQSSHRDDTSDREI